MRKLAYLAMVATLALLTGTATASAQTDEPDVLLDVPNLSIEEVTIEVENLDLHLSLNARLASLLALNAGLDVDTDNVSIGIKGVSAQLLLKVRLDNVAAILDRTLTTVDRNPQLLQGLLSTVSGLLNQTVNTLGQTVLRTVDATGNILERTLDNSGNILSQNVVGNVLNLPVLSETKNAAGQTVRRVQDTSGAVIELVLDATGKVLSTRVVSQAVGGIS